MVLNGEMNQEVNTMVLIRALVTLIQSKSFWIVKNKFEIIIINFFN